MPHQSGTLHHQHRRRVSRRSHGRAPARRLAHFRPQFRRSRLHPRDNARRTRRCDPPPATQTNTDQPYTVTSPRSRARVVFQYAPWRRQWRGAFTTLSTWESTTSLFSLSWLQRHTRLAIPSLYTIHRFATATATDCQRNTSPEPRRGAKSRANPMFRADAHAAHIHADGRTTMS